VIHAEHFLPVHSCSDELGVLEKPVAVGIAGLDDIVDIVLIPQTLQRKTFDQLLSTQLAVTILI
jgi:hypothetical protein